MDLTKTIELFEELRSKVSKNQENYKQRVYLSGNETVTRVLLIDPVLEILGWEVRNLDLVELEFEPATSKRDKADYVLKNDGNNVAIVEAKKFDTRIDELAHREQADGYARFAGVKFFVLTDGAKWRLYERDLMTGLEDLKPIVKFDLENDDLTRCALKSLALWRANLGLGLTPTMASEPTLVPIESDNRPKTEHNRQEAYPNPSTASVSPAGYGQSTGRRTLSSTKSQSPSGDGWHDLANRVFIPTGKRAAAVRLRGEVVETRNFVRVAVKIASWLATEGFLTRDRCPIKSRPTGATYLVALEPIHEDGRGFRSSQELPNGMVMEASASTSDLLMFVRNLVELCDAPGEEISINWVERTQRR